MSQTKTQNTNGRSQWLKIHTVAVNKKLMFRTVSTIVARNVPIRISTVLMYRVRARGTIFNLEDRRRSHQRSRR